jgi:excisionase family DNA binding protein
MNTKQPTAVSTPRLAVSVEEAAEMLSLGRSSIFMLLKEGQLKSVKAGKRRLIPIVELEAFLARLAKGA